MSSVYNTDNSTLIQLHKTYARPFLYYASVINSPNFMYLIDTIESFQRHITKLLHGLKDISYTKRLNICNIESLEIRRLHVDLITLYKIIHGFLIAIMYHLTLVVLVIRVTELGVIHIILLKIEKG